MAIPMLKIRRPNGRLIFNMGITIPGKTVFLIETAPRIFCENYVNTMAADDLAPYVARPSAAVVLTMHDKSLSSKIKDFNYLHHLSFEIWYKM